MKNKEYLLPPIVLIGICLVVTAVLAITYQFTLPKIQEARIAAATASRSEVMPAADDFQLYEGELDNESIDEIYFAFLNGERVGCVVTATVRGFGGDYTVMSGYDTDGVLTGVTVTSSNETPGLGTKTTASSYTSRFIGKNADDYTTVDAITGATVSSNALKSALAVSFAAQESVMGVTE